jgi:hypothetical protein
MSPFGLPFLWSPHCLADSPEKCTGTNIFSPFFPSGCSLNKYVAVIGISLSAWDFTEGLRFFLTFSRLDVPYINRGLHQEMSTRTLSLLHNAVRSTSC